MKNKLILFLLLIPSIVVAQDLSVLLGTATENQTNQIDRAFQVEYTYRYEYIGLSASYLNEGDVIDHKRDGMAAQFRLYAPIPSDRFSLSFGCGPYRWYDTQPTTIARGWAGLYGVTGTYAITDTVIAKASWNRVESDDLRDSDVFLVGFGYRWK